MASARYRCPQFLLLLEEGGYALGAARALGQRLLLGGESGGGRMLDGGRPGVVFVGARASHLTKNGENSSSTYIVCP